MASVNRTFRSTASIVPLVHNRDCWALACLQVTSVTYVVSRRSTVSVAGLDSRTLGKQDARTSEDVELRCTVGVHVSSGG